VSDPPAEQVVRTTLGETTVYDSNLVKSCLNAMRLRGELAKNSNFGSAEIVKW
jgi:hypothetical protein